jgi:polysaccharide biosynthesis transport protein
MLDRTSGGYGHGPYERTPDDGEFISLSDITRFLFRNVRTIGACTVLAFLVAFGYVLTATPRYTARVQLLIETNIPDSFRQNGGESNAGLDAPQVETQLAIIRSDRVAEKVARKLGLLDEAPKSSQPQSVSPLKWLISLPFSLFQSSEPVDEPEEKAASASPLRGAISRVLSGLNVGREGYSYAINISYTDTDPKAAAKFANAIANAYVEDRLETRAMAARQGSDWLEQRIDDLRKQMIAAALAVQRFKAKRDYRIVGMRQRGSAKTGSTSRGAADRNSAAGPVTSGVRAGNAAAQPAAPPADDNRGANGQEDAQAADAQGADTQGAAEPQTLEELETRAATYRKIYESYLQAYADSVQRQSYPVTNARVITPAASPAPKSHPRSKLVLALGLVFGGGAGLGIALLMNSLDRKVRTSRQVREELGIECLGRITNHEAAMPGMGRVRGRHWIKGLLRRLVGLPFDSQNDSDVAYRLSEVHDLPFSRFSTSIRSVRTAINLATKARPLHTIGVTSAIPKEGKTTFVSNLAALYAMSNLRVLIVDADVHNPTLSRILAPDRDLGLIEALEGQAALSDCILQRESTQPDILPLAGNTQAFDSAELICSDTMRSLIETLRQDYDLILFDLAPLKPVVDGLALCPLLDGIVLVAEWANSPVPVLAEALHDLRRVSATPLGVVLTKVEERAEEGYGGRGSYRSRDYMVDA